MPGHDFLWKKDNALLITSNIIPQSDMALSASLQSWPYGHEERERKLNPLKQEGSAARMSSELQNPIHEPIVCGRFNDIESEYK